jgi:stage V sporulation protein B
VIAIMSLLNLMQTTGLPQTISRAVSSNKLPRDVILKNGYKLQITTTTILTLLFIIIAYPLSILLNDRNLFQYLIGAAFILPSYGIYALQSGYLNGVRNFLKQALNNIIYSISKLIFIVVLTIKWGLAGAIIAFIIAPFFSIVFARIPYPRVDTTQYPLLFNTLLKESLPFIGIAFILMAFQTFDLLFVKGMDSNDAVAGYYSVSQSIALIPFLGFAAIGQVIYPNISSLISKGRNAEASKLITQSFRYLTLLVTPLICVMIVTASDLVKLLYGSAYMPAVKPLRILLVAYMFLSIFFLLINVLNGAHYTNISVIISLSGLLVTIIACPIFIIRIGYSGAAIATLIGTFLLAILAIYKTHQVLKFKIYTNSLLRIFLASLLISLAAISISLAPYFLPVEYILLGIIYLAFLAISGEFSTEDKVYIKKLIMRRQ